MGAWLKNERAATGSKFKAERWMFASRDVDQAVLRKEKERAASVWASIVSLRVAGKGMTFDRGGISILYLAAKASSHRYRRPQQQVVPGKSGSQFNKIN